MKKFTTLQDLAQNLRSDCYYFVSQFGLGDTYYLLGFKQALEQKFGAKIIFVIQPAHEVVCEMFECEDYEICSDTRYIHSEKYPALLQFKNVTKAPKLGTLFPAHPIPLGVSQTLDYKNMPDLYVKFFDLPRNVTMDKPSKMPIFGENLRAKLVKIAPLEKIVFYLPEAQSMRSLPLFIYKSECKALQKQGYAVISNINKERKYLGVNGVYDLCLSMQDAVALALACKAVISMHSGFCDIIALNCKNLKVYYPSKDGIKGSSLKDIDKNCAAKEVSFECEMQEFSFMLQNLQSSLPLKLYNRYIAKGFLRRVRTPFTAYFKIYKNHKKQVLNEANLRNLENFSGENSTNLAQNLQTNGEKNSQNSTQNSRNLAQNSQQNDFCKELLNDLAQTYEYQLGLLLEKACKGFWRGGFVWFIFDYLKLCKIKARNETKCNDTSENQCKAIKFQSLGNGLTNLKF